MKKHTNQKEMLSTASSDNGRNIAYIIQMKAGLNRFIYREIKSLHESGINVILFPLRYSKGPYMPEDSWEVFYPTPLKILVYSATALIRHPLKTLGLLKESITSRSSIDFLIALHFSAEMSKKVSHTFIAILRTINFSLDTIVKKY